MAKASIIDPKLLIRQDYSNPGFINHEFAGNRKHLAHLLSQLLIYDRVVIPTYDFGILEAMLTWLGSSIFQEAMEAGAISFVRHFGLLSYVGAGNGISVTEVRQDPTPYGTKGAWPIETLYFGSGDAINYQLKIVGGFPKPSLAEIIQGCSTDVQYDNDTFIEKVAQETYKDILHSPNLLNDIRSNNGEIEISTHDQLANLSQIRSDQIRVLDSSGRIGDSIDLMLTIAEFNLNTLIASQFQNADLSFPATNEELIASKFARSGFQGDSVKSLYSLFDLNQLPDIRPAIENGSLHVSEIWKIRNSKNGKQFRSWLKEVHSADARELERKYVEALGKKTMADSLPLRTLRWMITTGAGLVAGPLGLLGGAALSGADSFFIDQWLRGYSPKIFIESIKRLAIQE